MGRVFKFRMIASYKLHGKMFCWSSNGGFNPPPHQLHPEYATDAQCSGQWLYADRETCLHFST